MTFIASKGSAQVHLRMPHGLHEHVKKLAVEQGVSTNSLMVLLLAGATGWKLYEAEERS